jgi:hypothetical protein
MVAKPIRERLEKTTLQKELKKKKREREEKKELN